MKGKVPRPIRKKTAKNKMDPDEINVTSFVDWFVFVEDIHQVVLKCQGCGLFLT